MEYFYSVEIYMNGYPIEKHDGFLKLNQDSYEEIINYGLSLGDTIKNKIIWKLKTEFGVSEEQKIHFTALNNIQ